MTWHSDDELNKQADDIAARIVEVSFRDASDVEVAISRVAVSFTPAGDAGADAAQVALVGRAWSQMFTVTIPDGVTVNGLGLHDSTSLRSIEPIPPQTGPYSWTLSTSVKAQNRPS